MQTWKDSIYLAKEKMLSTLYQKDVSLHMSDEVETGSAGEQPDRNNPNDRNGQGGKNPPIISLTIPRNNVFENSKNS